MSEVKISTDKNYIKSILPKLEKLKSYTEEVINSYLESIVDPKIKEKLRHLIWAEVMNEGKDINPQYH